MFHGRDTGLQLQWILLPAVCARTQAFFNKLNKLIPKDETINQQ